MSLCDRFLLINNIKLPVDASVMEAFSVAKQTLKRAGLLSLATDYSVYRRSIDARKKPDIYFVYSIAVSGDFSSTEYKDQKAVKIAIAKLERGDFTLVRGE